MHHYQLDNLVCSSWDNNRQKTSSAAGRPCEELRSCHHHPFGWGWKRRVFSLCEKKYLGNTDPNKMAKYDYVTEILSYLPNQLFFRECVCPPFLCAVIHGGWTSALDPPLFPYFQSLFLLILLLSTPVSRTRLYPSRDRSIRLTKITVMSKLEWNRKDPSFFSTRCKSCLVRSSEDKRDGPSPVKRRMAQEVSEPHPHNSCGMISQHSA